MKPCLRFKGKIYLFFWTYGFFGTCLTFLKNRFDEAKAPIL